MVKITIYTAPQCPHSKRLKEFLASKGVKFDEICVLDDPKYFEEINEKTNQKGIPVIIIDDSIFVGFGKRVERRISRLIGG